MKEPNVKVCLVAMGLLMLMSSVSWMYMRIPQYELMAEGYDNTSWILSGYIIAEVAVVIVAGYLTDRIGAKNAVLIGSTLFSGAALSICLCDSVELMIAMRAIQGAGAGFLFTVSMSFIPKIYPKSERVTPHKVVTAAFSLGSILGSAIGYYFVIEVGDWKIFTLITAAICIVSAIVAYVNLPEFERDNVRDVAGSVMVILTIGSLMLFTQMVNENFELMSWQSLAFFEFCLILAAILIFVERKVRNPIIPYGIRRTDIGLMAGMFLAGFCGLGMLQFLTMFIMITYGLNLYEAVGMLLTIFIGGGATSVLGGKMLYKEGIRPLALTGPVLIMIAYLAGYFLLTRGLIGVAVTIIVIGLGFGFIVTEMVLSIQATSPVKNAGSYTGLLMASRFTGIILGMAVYKSIIDGALEDYLGTIDVPGDDVWYWIMIHFNEYLNDLVAIFQDTVQQCCLIAGVTVISVIIVTYFMVGTEDLDTPEFNDSDRCPVFRLSCKGCCR